METYYIVLVGILFILAFSDLIVGVSNDAVNFLNSAIGSKAGSFNTIMIFAALGILFGAVFSSGMMEVARKGIFHPQNFYFSEIMLVFLAVMLADIILLDLFNTFGMPTSTTVSIVFELLGAAVAMALIKIYNQPDHLSLGEYINSAKALAIISGILLSVVVSLISGAIVQYFVRMVFTFNYEETLKRYGAIWGAISFSGIVYFILIKGVKGASFMTKEMKDMILDDWLSIIGISFVVFLVLFYILQKVLKVNILKVIVLVGTFALATAFASNDLVNFIGVPMAAYHSFQFYAASGQPADSFLMGDLVGKVSTETWMLLISGLVMVLTLRFSRKARSVTETEVNLGRQEEGYERFGSNLFARVVVQSVVNGHRALSQLVPSGINNAIASRFLPKRVNAESMEGGEVPHFDLLRASVNILMAAILISYGTSMHLPLSTTYVTFMVAMGTSLSDRAWGRESAVYRVSGVLAVIGGWFFTALFAFSLAFIILNATYFGGKFAVFGIIALAIFFIFQTHFLHKKREAKKDKLFKEAQEIGKISNEKLIERSKNTIHSFMSEFDRLVQETLENLSKENRKGLRNTYGDFLDLNEITKNKKDHVSKVIDKLSDDALESGYHYVQSMDYLREMAHSVRHIVEPSLAHLENSHKPLIVAQNEDLHNLSGIVDAFVANANQHLESGDSPSFSELSDLKTKALKEIAKARKRQIKRIKSNEVGTRNSMLYFELLTELKNFILFGYSLVKSHDRLVRSSQGFVFEDEME